MKHTRYTVHPEAREALVCRLAAELEKDPAVVFAYLHGSLLDSEAVHDVDVGLYLRESDAERGSAVASALSARLSIIAGLPVDVRVLNEAPLSFVYHVLRGRLLLCRDEDLLTTMLEDVARRYLDLAPLLYQGTKDAFAA
ncbi:MAG: nucleotidyltransferase domain-containing protein [Nitrospira sp.]|nr:nucleotidyltransferase domain-containing protein [Nitrospira sp.]